MWYYVEILTKTQDLDKQLFLHVDTKKPLNEFPLIVNDQLPTVNVLGYEDFSDYKLAVMAEASEDDLLLTTRALCDVAGFDITVRNVLGDVVAEYLNTEVREVPEVTVKGKYSIILSCTETKLLKWFFTTLWGKKDFKELGFSDELPAMYRDLWAVYTCPSIVVHSVDSPINTHMKVRVECELACCMVISQALATTFGVTSLILSDDGAEACAPTVGEPAVARAVVEALRL